MVIAALFYQAMTVCMQQNTLYGEIGYMYTYGFYLFFDFAGYSHMAIGAGYIFGIKVPENFDRPFISKDIKEFWNRWHMTLSMWFRDFIFSRMMMRILKKKVFKKQADRFVNRICGKHEHNGSMAWPDIILSYVRLISQAAAHIH